MLVFRDDFVFLCFCVARSKIVSTKCRATKKTFLKNAFLLRLLSVLFAFKILFLIDFCDVFRSHGHLVHYIQWMHFGNFDPKCHFWSFWVKILSFWVKNVKK